MSKYGHLDKGELLRLLERRDAERPLGLVWERDEIEADAAVNDDFVALSLDENLSFSASATGDRGPGTGDRGPGTGDRGPGTGDRGPGYFDAHFEGFGNLIIEGDNFDALRALRLSHKGAIRSIYIDPPYNTGNRDFVYNDHFVDKTHRFRHSLWLEFMYRRLLLAKELLADDGMIFVSIDDNELFRLGMLMDRVFGEQNKLGVLIWKNVTDNNPSRVVTEHEYMLVYARENDSLEKEWKSTDVAIKEAMLGVEARLLGEFHDVKRLQVEYASWFRSNKDQLTTLDNYKYIDHGGIYAGSRSVHNPGKEGYRYDVLHPTTGEPCKQPLMGYRFPEKTMRELLAKDRILFGDDHAKLVELKVYLKDYRSKLASVIDMDGRAGPNELKRIFNDEKVFNNPKPPELLKTVLSFVTSGNDIVLDFFGGSGTLAQAVAKLNAEDGGTRKFILVSSTEATEDDPDKNLCRDVCAERVRRVLGGYTNSKGEAVPGLGGNFAYLRARRVPRHRLAQKLEHAEVWCALQLLHARALTVWAGQGFAADGPLAYLADFHAAHVQRLRDWLATRDEQESTLYSWSTARVAELVGERLGLRCLPIPQHLRDRFGR